MWSELLRSFRLFIARDVTLIVAGACPMFALLYVSGRGETIASVPMAGALLFAGISYFVGYALQDATSLAGLTTTAAVWSPTETVKADYKRFLNQTDFPEISLLTEEDRLVARERIADPHLRARLERLVTFKQIGTAGGPAFVLSGLIVAGRVVAMWRSIDPFDVALSTGAMAIGWVLIKLSWVKAAQHAAFIHYYGRAKSPVRDAAERASLRIAAIQAADKDRE